jgi:hypothetical protein
MLRAGTGGVFWAMRGGLIAVMIGLGDGDKDIRPVDGPGRFADWLMDATGVMLLWGGSEGMLKSFHERETAVCIVGGKEDERAGRVDDNDRGSEGWLMNAAGILEGGSALMNKDLCAGTNELWRFLVDRVGVDV